MKRRLPLMIAVPAIPLLVAIIQWRLFPALTSPAGWYVTAASVVILTIIVIRSGIGRRLELLTGNSATGRPLLMLLLASAAVPFGSELIVKSGQRLGLYREGTVIYLHVLIATMVLLVVSIEAAGWMQRVEARRLLSEQTLRLQIERMPIAHMTLSPQFEITSWSPAAERIFGWKEQEIVGRSAGELFRGNLPGDP